MIVARVMFNMTRERIARVKLNYTRIYLSDARVEIKVAKISLLWLDRCTRLKVYSYGKG